MLTGVVDIIDPAHFSILGQACPCVLVYLHADGGSDFVRLQYLKESQGHVLVLIDIHFQLFSACYSYPFWSLQERISNRSIALVLIVDNLSQGIHTDLKHLYFLFKGLNAFHSCVFDLFKFLLLNFLLQVLNTLQKSANFACMHLGQSFDLEVSLTFVLSEFVILLL